MNICRNKTALDRWTRSRFVGSIGWSAAVGYWVKMNVYDNDDERVVRYSPMSIERRERIALWMKVQ